MKHELLCFPLLFCIEKEIDNLVNIAYFSNAYLPIEYIEEEIDIYISEKHLQKEFLFIYVTKDGIDDFTRDKRP